MKADALLDALRQQYPSAHGWVLLPQVPDSTGAGSGRTADALAFNAWPSRGLELHGFELKTHRGDWLRELKKPAKAESIFKYCDRWWIVIPDEGPHQRAVRSGELPSTWGLLVVDSKDRIKVATAAPKLKPRPLDRAFLASVLRRLAACEAPAGKLASACAAAREEGVQAGRREERARLEHRSHRTELRYQRENLGRLEEMAVRTLASIRRELSGLKDIGEGPENEACGVVGMPNGERRVCELPQGHEKAEPAEPYHREGGVRWLGSWPQDASA